MSYVIGYPRIGEKRELKFVLEKYWRGEVDFSEVEKVAKELKTRHWNYQKKAGIKYISSNDFSYYDQMIDMIVMLGCEPDEYKDIDGIDRYFAMARGDKNHKALPMTKWLNTNYHYFVPQLQKNQTFKLNLKKVLNEYFEAKEQGIETKVNLIGPVTFLSFSRTIDGSDPLDLIEKLVDIYNEAIIKLKENGVEYIQFEEPALVKDPTPKQLEALKIAYNKLNFNEIKSFVITYFERANEAVEILLNSSIYGIGLDFVHGPKNIDSVENIAKSNKILIAGVVDGRNVWISDIDKKIAFLNTLPIEKDRVIVSTSCSLLHVPYTLKYEKKIDKNIKSWLAFANEKLDEIRIIDKLYREIELKEDKELYEKNKIANAKRVTSTQIHNKEVQDRLKNLTKEQLERSMPALDRLKIQHEILKYPILPTTTIGSFPQTHDVRKVRKDYKEGIISKEEYENKIKEFIEYCVKIQEEIGLDILVHGEFERNDMVEYFGEMLNGVTFSENGWVQSYGSRCVKPPIIFGDISRPKPMTVKWIKFAQSLTSKIVKGMLTGPVTMLNWSFVRDDLDKEDVYKQMALAISDEVKDLQEAGIKIIQVDEAAFKEGYPLRKENRENYEKVAVTSFKIATAPTKPQTQIHTHMCYSDFNDIMPTIDAMDADVISIETARNGNRLLEAFRKYNYKKEIGAGVYDIHSPRVPTKEEIVKEIEDRLKVLPAKQLWINPDCGLKTRKWEEVIPSLKNMVEATKEIRDKIFKI
ncbi:5-methyltetrahydropteroyltriglutamate--homocysteine S-methyltransferase [Nitrosophilus kaiyonis]|uniref:5-methyltetrahydropteroyltriglutamate-- homocysteine S-methyltransferase n=1 Tax=Nitrosophilus kaiyonis TaxID=2930200 RepID=UPI00248F58C1|nr:5-methyltetrahydropteroyltriglutamate--homocysteine S-methyltransferase [Nitrosophilus kaiyonis]